MKMASYQTQRRRESEERNQRIEIVINEIEAYNNGQQKTWRSHEENGGGMALAKAAWQQQRCRQWHNNKIVGKMQ
jgi:hypothetical protein